MPTIAPPAGYKHAAQVTVTGGGAAVNGSTSAPTPSGTDYVVLLQLTGSTAQSVYNGITDTTSFSDVSMWFWTGSAWTQIDCDIDTDTFGAWSTSNIALKFKLQEALAASPTTDGNYMLAWGQSGSLTTKQSWANIYPLSDSFDGVQGSMGSTASTLGSSTHGWTTALATGGTATVSSGQLAVAQSSASTSRVNKAYSNDTFGASYCVDAFVAYSTNPTSGSSVVVNFGNSGITTYIDSGVIGYFSASQYEGYNHLTTTATSKALGALAGANTFTLFSAARDSNGLGYASIGGAALASVGTATLTTALPFMLYVSNAANNTQTGTCKWVKVRPFTATEPTTSLGSIVSAWTATASATASVAYAITRTAAYMRRPSATGALASAYAHTLAHLRPVARTASIVSSTARSMAMHRARIATASLSSASSRRAAYGRSHAETVSTVRAVTHTLAHLRAATRTAAISSSKARTVTYKRAVTAMASTARAISQSMSHRRPIARTVSYATTATRTVTYHRAVTTTASVARTVTRAFIHLRSVARTATITASAVRMVVYHRTHAATSSTATATGRTLTHVRSVARTAAITAINARTATYHRAAAKVASWATAASNTLSSGGHTAWSTAASATVSISRSVTRHMSMTRPALRAVSASTHSFRVMTINRAPSAATSFTHGVSRVVGYVVHVARSASLSASTARTMALHRAASATGGVVGAASRHLSMARSAVRQAAIQGHLFFAGLSSNFHNWTRYASATVAVSGSVQRVAGYRRSAAASVQMATSTVATKTLALARALWQVAARVFSFTAAPRALSFTVAARNFDFTATGTPMPATPDTNGKNFIASTETSIPFRCDFTPWLQVNETISAATITMSGVLSSNPGQDISANAAALLAGSSVSNPVVTVNLGNKNAMIGAVYTVRIDVTTNQGRGYAETIGPIYCTY